jgi:hypothetical protein
VLRGKASHGNRPGLLKWDGVPSTWCYTRAVRVFALPQVTRLLRKERLPDAALCAAAREALAGRLGTGEADLGAGLWKKRLARPGRGKSGGYRAIVAYRRPRTERVLFAYAFPKNAAATLTPVGHEALAKVAGVFVATNEERLAVLLAAGDVAEVRCDDEG